MTLPFAALLPGLLSLLLLAACSGGAPDAANSGGGTQGQGPGLQSGPGGEDTPGGTDGGAIDKEITDGGNVDNRTEANLTLSPSLYDYSVQSVGSTTHKAFTLTNTGEKPAEDLRLDGLSGAYSLRGGTYPGTNGTCGSRLLGGASCTVQISFHPTALGRFQLNTVRFRYNANSPNKELFLSLDGMATNISTLRFSNLVDDNTFSDLGTLAYGVTVTKTIHVTFYGSRPASGVSFSGITSPFQIVSNSCGTDVSTDCDLVITFTSATSASFSQRLKVTYDNTSYAAEDTHDLLATGTSYVAPATLAVANANFGRVIQGTTAHTLVTVTKGGSVPATAVSATAFTDSSFRFVGGVFPGTAGTCTSTITSNCTLDIEFAPTSVSASSAALVLNYHDGNAITTASGSLSGQGATAALLSLSPSTPINFGSYALGQSADRSFTLSNASTAVSATGISLTGVTGHFSTVSSCPTTLGPGGSCNFTVRFRPTTAGLWTNNLTFSYFDGQVTRSDLTTEIQGTGTSGALLVPSTTNYNFGNVLVGNSTTATLSLNYFGGLAANTLQITGMSDPFAFTGGVFPGGGTCTATISAACTFRVTFSPTAVQSYSISVVFSYDDGTGTQRSFTVVFRGNGINPVPTVLSLAPSSHNFGNVAVLTSNVLTVTVSRTGSFAATSLSASGLSGDLGFLGGTYPGTGGTCGTTLSGASCTLRLVFSPQSAQTLAQTLSLSYFDGSQTQTAATTFSGNSTHLATLGFSGTSSLGSAPLGTAITTVLTLTNTGTGTATALALSSVSPFVLLSENCTPALSAGSSCQVQIQEAASFPGSYSRALDVSYQNGFGAAVASRTLTSSVTVPALLATNGNHGCARSTLGTLKCWGQNNYGQLGLGDTVQRTSPTAVALGSNRYAKTIAVGYWHSCAILNDDSLKCWGNNLYGQLGLGTTATPIGAAANQMGDALASVDLGTGAVPVQIAAGYSHTCALLSDGRTKCWGQNSEGQLGLADTQDRGLSAEQMGDALPFVDLGGVAATSLSLNTSHSCATLETGATKCWGNAFYGQLGQGSILNQGDSAGEMGGALAPIDLGTGSNVAQVAAGGAFTCVRLDSGEVKCFGRNEEGILGVNYCQDASGNFGPCSDPQFPLALRGIGTLPQHMGVGLASVELGSGLLSTLLATANSSTCSLFTNGSTKCWGRNENGQLGLGDTVSRGMGSDMGDSLPTVDLGTAASITNLQAGAAHFCALFATNQIKCWGDNRFGNLGLGDTNSRGDSAGEMGASLPFLSF